MLEENEPNEAPENSAAEAADPGTDPEASATPRRRRRAASRPAGPPAGTSPETSGPETPAASRASQATPVPADVPADQATAEGADAPVRPRRRAAGKAAAAAAAAETPAADGEAAEPPARTRRRATRKATSPAGPPKSGEPAAADESAAAADAPAKAPQGGAPAESGEAATGAPAPRTRRRAAREATAPAAADEAPVTAGEAAEKPTRTRRRTSHKAEAEAAGVEETRAEAEPASKAGAGADAEPEKPKGRRVRKRSAAPAAPFLPAADEMRRLKRGALAEPVTYGAKAFRDGDGWAVEIENAFEIRGYGETLEQAREKAVEAVAEAFGVPAGSVTVEVRPETDARAAVVTETETAPETGPRAEAEAETGPRAETEPEPEPRSRRRRVVGPPTAVFQAPVFAQAAFQAPEEQGQEGAGEQPEHSAEAATETGTSRRRRRRRDEETEAAEAATTSATTSATDAAEEEAPEGDAEGAYEDESGERPSRRRRRGGRRRRRGEAFEGAEEQRAGAGGTGSEEDRTEAAAEGESEEAESDEAEGEEPDGVAAGTGGSRRRRRRRRRSGEAAEAETGADDPERTVVKVREPRPARDKAESSDEVQSIKGSTRLEAKKQRRREGREQGRRRVPIITEAEFLARREAVERVMVVRENGDRTQIGVLEDNVLVEHYVNKEQATSYVGNVYQGKVQNVLPSMEAAFVDIGKGRNAVLYAGEVNFEALGFANGPRRIESALKSGQSVLVQVTKDPIGHKGARLTSQVSLPGRYLVYVPEGSMTGISRKLPDTERARLKQILKKIVPEDAGVIVRTAAEGASEDELARDVQRLQAQWEDIQRTTKTGNAPTLLYGEPDMTVRVVRDIFNEDFTKVIVSGDDAWETIHGYVSHVAPDLVGRLQRWTSEVDVFATYRIDEQLLKALDRKVWLPSGGSLVIDKTEAMVVVDVNTGKFTGQGGNLEETVTRNNLEAAEEIVRQLRLRDLGGIVVIDFIDMVLESNRDLVMRRLLECLGRDRTKHQVAEVTSLGLIQMTRKRVGQGLLESFSESCVHCNGRGVIVHMDQATAVGGGGGGKRRRRGRGAGEEQPQETVAAPEPEPIAEAVADAVPVEVVEPEPAPATAAEAETRAAAGAEDGEWFGGPAEAVSAATARRGRRRAARRVSAPVASPAPAQVVVESALEAPEPEPEAAPAAGVAAEGPIAEAAPPRARRRVTRTVTAPVSEAAVVVVPAAAAEAPVAEPEPRPEPEPVAEAPVPARRRVARKVTAPAGPPTTASEGDAAVVVVTVPGTDAEIGGEIGGAAEPKKRAARKSAAERTTAKKTVAKKTAVKKTVAKETAAKETAAKKTAAKKTAVKKTAAKKTAAKKTAAKTVARKMTAAAAQTPAPGVSAGAVE